MSNNSDLKRMRDVGPLKMQSGMANETKQEILDQPLLLTFLFGSEARRVLLEWIVRLAENNNYETFSKVDISRETGLSRKTVGEHIDILHQIGLIEADGNKRPRYRVRFPPQDDTQMGDSPLDLVMEFNEFLADHTDFEELYDALKDYS